MKLEVYRTSDKNIIVTECFLTIVVLSLILNDMTNIHTALCIAISIIVASVAFAFFNTEIGFVIISIFFSAMWALLIGYITYNISKHDWIWTIVVGIFVFLISFMKHGIAKRYEENVEEY